MKGWKYEIGTTIEDISRNITLTNKERRTRKYFDYSANKERIKNEKWYQYTCNNCGWTNGWINEADITKGVGCGCCRGFKIVKGINDFGTKFPEKIIYFANENDAYTHSYNSGKEVQLRCPKCGWSKKTNYHSFANNDFYCEHCNSLPIKRPDVVDYFINKEDAWLYTPGCHTIVSLRCKNCGNIKSMSIKNLCTDGFSCEKCSDGISYPEKFIACLLSQLNIKYIHQFNKKHNEWCDKYRYDFYLIDFDYIIEVHGDQHYSEKHQFGTTTLQEVQTNDKIKKGIAIANGIKKYIVVPAKKSRLSYLKKEIIKTMGKYFNMEEIDWIKCNQQATKSIVKYICDFYNTNNNMTIKEISKMFHIAQPTVREYLIIGNENHWCNYKPKTRENFCR